MKIRVIDLLNKIANGEEVPKKIKCLGIIHEYCEINKFYYTEDGSSLYREMFTEGNCLDDEIEIIEEDKEIEYIKGDYTLPVRHAKENEAFLASCLFAHEDKINELIKVVNVLKKGK